MSVICIKTIAELKEMSFFIPSYQRGYRWKDIQVEQLLNDLWEFYQDNKAKPDAWYCLQPLVVKNVEGKASTTDADNRNVLPCGHVISPADETGATWTVIDGQQRLTTLFLVLSQLGGDNIKPIEYETRKKSREFLLELTAKQDAGEVPESNPDYYYMAVAVNTITKWLNGHLEIIKSDFAQTILNQTKFIWYETTENHYKVFIRLNSGKISLSNAELIKALLLRENRFSDKDGSVKLQQLEIASEWDRIEQTLGNDEFWYFINPDAESPRFNATRIDFLFELVLRKGILDVNDDLGKTFLIPPIPDFVDELVKNPYFAFAKFVDLCKASESYTPEKTIWSEIQSVFRRIKSWHADRSLYHYVGFLMNQKSEDKNREQRLDSLKTLLDGSTKQSKSDFLIHVKTKCRSSISDTGCFLSLDYRKHNAPLNNILLLFNLALLDRQDSEQSRYPFHLHIQKQWSIEHIHAQKPRNFEPKDIETIKKLYPGKNTVEEISEALKRDSGMEIITTEDGKKKLEFSDASDDSEEVDIMSGEDMLNSLKNLALLGGKENSGLNNKMYLEKKVLLSKWEHSSDTRFIPIGTRMVFFKHFSPSSTLPFAWTVQDGDAYLAAIEEMVTNYVSASKEVEPSQAEPTNNGEYHD